MAFTVVAFGEMLWDLLPSGPALGGAPFNFAYRVASLGDRVVVVSRLGDDDLGREALAAMAALGMDASCVQVDPAKPTGTVPVSLDPAGTPVFTIVPDVAYDRIEATAGALAAVEEADCLCFGTLAQRSPASARTLRLLLERFRGRVRLLDLNLRRDCWTPESVRASIDRADVLKLNDDEAVTIAPLYGLADRPLREFPRALMAATGLSHVVLTLGAGGAFAASRDGAEACESAHEVTVVDTVGAGDAFTAAFAHGLLAGWPLARSLAHGNALGALVAAQRGATGAVVPADVERLLAADRRRAPDPRFARAR
jgi:fructokinase